MAMQHNKKDLKVCNSLYKSRESHENFKSISHRQQKRDEANTEGNEQDLMLLLASASEFVVPAQLVVNCKIFLILLRQLTSRQIATKQQHKEQKCEWE